LRGGELVTAVNGEPIQIWSDLRWKAVQLAVAKTPVRLDVERPDPGQADGKLLETITLPLDSLTTEDLETDFLAKLGVTLARVQAKFDKIPAEGPAHDAGLREGDLVLTVNGKPVADGSAFIEMVRASPGKPLNLAGVRSDGSSFTAVVVPRLQSVDGRSVAVINAPLKPDMTIATSPPGEALAKAVKRTWDTSALTLKMLGKMVIGEVSWKNVTGPITIADYAGQTARIGLISFLSFIALISISLGVMNLLPIPVLDGGLLLYYSLEVLTGRPVSERVGEIAQRAGLGILMMLMTLAVFNDIVRIIQKVS
jgi:regulator of sigma E protease